MTIYIQQSALDRLHRNSLRMDVAGHLETAKISGVPRDGFVEVAVVKRCKTCSWFPGDPDEGSSTQCELAAYGGLPSDGSGFCSAHKPVVY